MLVPPVVHRLRSAAEEMMARLRALLCEEEP
jgi:hypothetical protein